MPTTRITVDEYERMVDSGALTENERVELIRGEIGPKTPIGPKHAACLKRLRCLPGIVVGVNEVL
jgi:hypothetical protein